MKNLKKFIIFILILCLLSCAKKNKLVETVSQNIENFDLSNYEEEENVTTIDFDKMHAIIDSSKSMNVDVFFAISVLHRKFILTVENEASKLPEQEQAKFYEEKRKSFFDTIKYSEKQYNDFVADHQTELNNYINQYPDIAKYLTTTN